MRHKVGNPLQHTPRLENECRKGHPGQVHPYPAPKISAMGVEVGRECAYRSWEMSDAMMEPSFSSLQTSSSAT
jgi:hypothetical protein